MFDGAGIGEGYLRQLLWHYSFYTAVEIINLTADKPDQPTREELFTKELPRFSSDLRIFGEIGVVKKSGLTKKTENKGFDAMFIGYCRDRGKKVYRMLNLETRRPIITRDVKWLNINYGEWKNKLYNQDEDDSSDSSVGPLASDSDDETLVVSNNLDDVTSQL